MDLRKVSIEVDANNSSPSSANNASACTNIKKTTFEKKVLNLLKDAAEGDTESVVAAIIGAGSELPICRPISVRLVDMCTQLKSARCGKSPPEDQVVLSISPFVVVVEISN